MLKTLDGQSIFFWSDDLTLKAKQRVSFRLVRDVNWQQATDVKQI